MSDAQGKCVKVNSALSTLVGRGSEQLLGNGWDVMLHKDDKERVYSEWAQAVERQRSFESSFRVANTLTNKVYLVHATAQPFYARGVVHGWIGTYDSVSEVGT